MHGEDPELLEMTEIDQKSVNPSQLYVKEDDTSIDI